MNSITPHYRSIQQLLKDQSFAIDEYQREYKWATKNITELLVDLYSKFHNESLNIEDKDESIRTMYSCYQDIVNYALTNELCDALLHFVYWLLNPNISFF